VEIPSELQPQDGDIQARTFPDVHGQGLLCELCNEAPSKPELISLVPC